MPFQQSGSEAGRGRAVANPAAVTSANAAGAAPSNAEYNALRADVVALHGRVTDLMNALRDSNAID